MARAGAAGGGHVELGEGLREAARRELLEEFGIYPTFMRKLGVITGRDEDEPYMSHIYLCLNYQGTPKTDGIEMNQATFVKPEFLRLYNLFPPFEESLKLLNDD